MRSSVRVPLSGGREVTVEPFVRQYMTEGWFAFGDAECLCYEPLIYRFDVLVSDESVISRQEVEDHAIWNELQTICAPASAPDHGEDAARVDLERELWLGYLDVAELPVQLTAPDGDWLHVFDALGRNYLWAYEAVQSIQDQPPLGYDGALICGAVILPMMLGVHPAVRGQDVGIRLLAHALWALNRSTSDVAVIRAIPVKSQFDTRSPKRTRASYAKLCAHYERLGFARWEPDRGLTTPGATVMALPLGEHGVLAFREDGGRLTG